MEEKARLQPINRTRKQRRKSLTDRDGLFLVNFTVLRFGGSVFGNFIIKIFLPHEGCGEAGGLVAFGSHLDYSASNSVSC